MQYQVVPFTRRPRAWRFATTALAAAIFAIATFASTSAHAQTFNTVYTFAGGNQGSAASNLIFTPGGDLIGTAAYGNNCACYLTFSLSSGGKETVLHRFAVPFWKRSGSPKRIRVK
jgi:hypothetical protein